MGMTRLLAGVVVGHKWSFAALAAAILSYFALPLALALPPVIRATVAWDVGAAALLGLAARAFVTEGDDNAMARNARRQQEGEWTVFGVTLLGAAFSFVALTKVLASAKDLQSGERDLYIVLVATTLALSWLITHLVFAMRYAHEYYARSGDAGSVDDRPVEGGPVDGGPVDGGPVDGGPVDGGLCFPGQQPPDYWDFVYFAFVLGMTFQVSDVEVTSRKLRRLATLHGVLSFLFNTVIVALAVNIAITLL